MNFLKLLRPISKINKKIYCYQKHNAFSSSKTGKEISTRIYANDSYTNDELLQNIKTSTDALDLFDAISGRQKELTEHHVILSLRTLYNLQKSGMTTFQPTQILNHPEFQKLCQTLKFKSRSISLSDTIESLKFLSYLGVPNDSEITVILLNLIRQNINDIELNQIIFLEFLFTKFKTQTPLIEALRLALPILFQINLSIKIDHENVPQLTEFLAFTAKHRINDKSIMNIVSALTLHGTNLTLESAISIIWSLCEIDPFLSSYERLLLNAFNIINKKFNQIQFQHLESTLTRITNRFIGKSLEFYNEMYFKNCAKFIIEKNEGFLHGSYVLKRFNKIAFINIPLLDYMANKVIENPSLIFDAKPGVLFTFVASYANANYIPNNWNQIFSFILQNKLLQCDRHVFPWFKFALELASLNCYDENLIEKIFNDQFLTQFLDREQNVLDYLLMLSFYHSVLLLYPEYKGKYPQAQFLDKAVELLMHRNDFPLQKTLEFGFGGPEYVKTKVKSKHGHLIDHLIIFDGTTPISINDVEEVMETFKENQNLRPVAILTFSKNCYALNVPRLKGIFEMRLRTLEAMNIKTVAVNYQQWIEIPDHEKIPYLIQEIKYKLNK